MGVSIKGRKGKNGTDDVLARGLEVIGKSGVIFEDRDVLWPISV